MSLPRLALDCDDVIVDFRNATYSFLSHHYGIAVPSDFSQDPLVLLANHRGKEKLSSEESQTFYQRVDGYIADDISRCPFITGAQDGIQKLAEHYELVIVTARSQDRTHHISNFLAHHNLLEQIYAVYGSTLEELSKPVRARDLGAEVLVDDLASNLVGSESLGIRGILFERPWSCDDSGKKITYSGERVQGWEELTSLLLK